MAHILLLNFDPAAAKAVDALLRGKGHHVTVEASDHSQIASDLHRFDVVMIDMSLDNAAGHAYVTAVRNHRAEHGPRPMLLCISRIYRGPRFALDLERKGARVVYVR